MKIISRIKTALSNFFTTSPGERWAVQNGVENEFWQGYGANDGDTNPHQDPAKAKAWALGRKAGERDFVKSGGMF
tara:strand:+ start:519 stop:743 length:225 start_codon:yes stop_codon:yes gene_type:complete